MRKNRTRIARVFLAAIMLVLGSLYGYYYGREGMAKWAFAHQTDFGIDELTLITIPQTDLNSSNAYLASEAEFDWQGQMVDVLHREVRADTLFIYGFRDKAETELKQEAAWLYQDNDQSNKLPGTNIRRVKCYSPFVLPNQTIVPLAAFFNGLGLPQFSSCFSFFIRLPLMDVLSPPPDL